MTWTLEHLLSGMADAAVKATALLLAAALATLLVRRASAASRHFVWSLAAVGTLALPLLAAFLPSWRVAVLPPPEVSKPGQAVDVDELSLETLLLLPRAELAPAEELPVAVPAPLPSRRVHRLPAFRAELLSSKAPLVLASDERVVVPVLELPRRVHRAPSPWASARPWLGALWMAGCAFALFKILAGRIGVRLLSRRATPVTDPDALAVLERLRRRLGISRPVRLLQADRATLPMTWGTLRPAVLLPADAGAWTADRLEVVLLHELAHVRRLDALTQLIAQLACAVYWFHPLVWLAARRMRALREYACDDHVLAAGTRASAYAGEMLEMVRSLRSDPLAPASATLAMARRSQLEGRLLAILNPNLRRSAFGSRAGMAIGAMGLMVLMPLAALQPTAAAQPQPGGNLPRLSNKEAEKRKSTSVPEPTVAPAGSAAPAPVPVPAPAAAPAPPAPPGVPVPAAPPAPPALAAPPAPPAPPTRPAPPAPPAPAARSDDELLGALLRVARDGALEDPGAREAYLRACDRFRGGEARAKALRALLREAPIDPETGRAVLASARAIPGEDELLSVMKQLHAIDESDLVRGPLVMAYLEDAERLRSDEAMTKALVSLLHPEPIAREGLVRSLDLAASRLRSDEAKHRVLVEVTDHQAMDPQLEARYLQIVTAMKDAGLQADSRKRLEQMGDCEDRKTAVNIQVGRLPIRVQVDAEQFRREAEQMAREAERQGRQAAADAKRIAEESARHERLRERAREEAEQARRQWTAEGERLRAEAEKLKAQARQLSEQMRERARKLKQKLSKELPPDEVDELDLDSLDDLDFEL